MPMYLPAKYSAPPVARQCRLPHSLVHVVTVVGSENAVTPFASRENSSDSKWNG